MILELNNIDKSFGEKEVLKGVSFTAEGGKAFGLLGRNGAGNDVYPYYYECVSRKRRRGASGRKAD